MFMKNKYILILIVIVIIAVGYIAINSGSEGKNESSATSSSSGSAVDNMTPVEEISHSHGLTVDISNPNILYIATHHGLLLLKDEKQLYRVGENEDDYMGFIPHPFKSNIFFSSGHPAAGGNIGFQKSEDGGYSWQKISDGINGPVDFHALTISSVDPDLIFGWYSGTLQRSTNGGKSWEIIQNTQFPIVSLAADTKDENVLYAASPQGLYMSKDKGVSFERLIDGFVSVIAINPSNSLSLVSFSEKQGLAKSSDAGRTWERINEDFNGETPLFTSYSKQNPEVMYLLTEKNSIYKSIDSGVSWNKIF